MGEYANDKMHGEGVYTFANGEQQKIGLFHEGKFIGESRQVARDIKSNV